MFEKKITQKQVHEIHREMRDELTAELEKTIAERQEIQEKHLGKAEPVKVDELYLYQHTLEITRRNLDIFVDRIDVAINYK